MGIIFHKYLHISFVIVLALTFLLVIFKNSSSQANINSTSSNVIYSVANNSEKIDFKRGFLISITPVKWWDFSTLTHISIPTNLTEWSRVTVSIVERDGTSRILLMSQVKKQRIGFYTKRSGTFQIMKLGN